MDLLFIVDPLDSFKVYKDSTFAMMYEAARRGHVIWVTQPHDIFWRHGERVCAKVVPLELTGDTQLWYRLGQADTQALQQFSAVLMRKDPPFNTEYLYTTHLLTQAVREGARVFNDPQALREHSEKLAILEFPQFLTPTLVSSNIDTLKAFYLEHRDVIFKPLDGMGGMGIFRVGPEGINLGAILESLTRQGEQTIMAQRYLPAIVQGDKRILLINGVAVPYALARIPQGGEVRGNLAAGGKGVAQTLSERDQEIAQTLGPILVKRGLLLVGLDVIGDCLTEINVTSPTCFQEITQQTGYNVAQCFVDALEAQLARLG